MDNDVIKPNANKPEVATGSSPTPEVVSMPQKTEAVVGPKRKRSKKPLLILIVILLLLAAFAGGWFLRDTMASADSQKQAEQIEKLEKQVENLQAAQEQKADEGSEEPVGEEPDASVEIIQAFNDQNWDAVGEHMGASVEVTLPASECCGEVEKTVAVEQLGTSLESAEGPWDFGLSAEVLADYQDGDYASHFPDEALVGKSAGDQVVSMIFDAEGNISHLFIAFSDGLL